MTPDRRQDQDHGDKEDADDGPSRTGLLAAVLALVLLALAGFWLASVLRRQGNIEDCVLARRGNCDALVK